MTFIYQPAEDSYLLEKEVKRFVKGKSFLDMGAGSGIQSKAAKSAGASSILAVDIDSESIAHIKSFGIHSIKSNLFQKVKGRFDIIAFNPPYLPRDKREPLSSQLATTGGKHGDEIILKFIKSLKSHLNPYGFALIVISSLTPKDKILSLLKKIKLNHSVLSSKKLFMEKLFVWKIQSIN